MNFEQITAYLEEKFGIVLDWTSETALPMLKELAHRIATYNIVKDSIIVGICGIAIVASVFFFRKLFKAWHDKEYKGLLIEREERVGYKWEDRYEYNVVSPTGVALIVLSTVAVFFGTIFIIASSVDLTRWIFIPEIQLFDYIKDFMA